MSTTKTPVSLLNEAAQKHLLQLNYESAITILEDGVKKFKIPLKCKNYRVDGVSTTKKGAKQDAALQMLQQLKNSNEISKTLLQDIELQTHEETHTTQINSVNTIPNGSTPATNEINYVGLLNELCQKYGLPHPVYQMLDTSGQPHNLVFTVECRVSSTYKSGTSSTKKNAKQNAAEKVFTTLRDSYQSYNDTIPLRCNPKDHESVTKSIETLGITIQNLNIEDVQSTKSCNPDQITKIMNKFMQCKLKNKCVESIRVDEQHIMLRNRIQSISEIDQNKIMLIHSSIDTTKATTLETIISKAFKLESVEKVWLQVKTSGMYLVVIKLCVSPLITQFGIGSTHEAAEESALRKLVNIIFTCLNSNC